MHYAFNTCAGETHTCVQQLAMLSEALMFIADSIVHHFGTDAGDGADALRANVQLQQLWYR